MKKLASLVAAFAVLTVLAFAATATAVDAGQIEAGDIYTVANLTTGGAQMDPATASCGDIVQFRVRVHNIGAYPLENVKVAATLPNESSTSHSSMVTVSADNANAKTDTAGVKTDAATTISYVPGSAELLDANKSSLGSLSDTIVTTGVTLNDPIGVSHEQQRFVQFKAKLNCETPPTCKPGETGTPPNCTPPPTCKPGETGTPPNCTTPPVTPPKTPPATPPTLPNQLPNTGAGNVIGLFVGVVLAGTIGYRLFLSRKLARR